MYIYFHIVLSDSDSEDQCKTPQRIKSIFEQVRRVNIQIRFLKRVLLFHHRLRFGSMMYIITRNKRLCCIRIGTASSSGIKLRSDWALYPS